MLVLLEEVHGIDAGDYIRRSLCFSSFLRSSYYYTWTSFLLYMMKAMIKEEDDDTYQWNEKHEPTKVE